jgi:uncharacterized protein YjbJ (UPF0337 family)
VESPEAHFQEHRMNKEQLTGRIDEASGKGKEVTGKLVGNADLERKGSVRKNAGKARAGFADLKDDVKKNG